MKACVDCKQDLPFTDFWRDASRVDGLNRRRCAGKQHRGTRSYQQRENRQEIRLMSRYGITLAELSDMKRTQQGRCAVCGQLKQLVIDHNHTTGDVRGLLCHRCNIAVGFIEVPGLPDLIAEYLANHS